MFKNYLSTAIRNLLNNRLYSAINIFGLAIGLASCILILLFVLDELSYDRFWTNDDNTYRVHIRFEDRGDGQQESSTQVGGEQSRQLWIYIVHSELKTGRDGTA